MIRVKFNHSLFGEEIKVVASAKDVDAYGAVNLKLKFLDKHGEPVDIPFDRDAFDDLHEIASELLYERKYAKELEF